MDRGVRAHIGLTFQALQHPQRLFREEQLCDGVTRDPFYRDTEGTVEFVRHFDQVRLRLHCVLGVSDPPEFDTCDRDFAPLLLT